jgi:hypothetical protein
LRRVAATAALRRVAATAALRRVTATTAPRWCRSRVRLALVILLAACARPAPAPVLAGRPTTVPCDEAAWRQLASSPLRARVGDRDVIVVEEHGGWSRIAVTAFSAILAGEVPNRRLARVVKRETPVWDAPGGSTLPNLVVEPGLAVTGSGDWFEVDERYPITIHGYVPASATGRIWDAQPPPGTNGRRLGFYGDVLADPVASAQHVAGIAGGDPVVDSIEPGPAGWLKIAASDAQVRVTGWVAIPPPRAPSPLLHTYDFSDDTIEGELVEPDSVKQRLRIAPGCLRASPSDRAAVVGLATQPIVAEPAADGWLHVVLDTPWGRVDAYGPPAPPQPPPPQGNDSLFDWPSDYWRD